MILSKKHIKLSQSLLGISAIVLNNFSEINNLDNMYKILKKDKRINKGLSFENMILAIDFLYILGVVRFKKEGEIVLCD